MANIKSQIKRDHTNAEANAKNRQEMAALRTACKKVETLAAEGKKPEAQAALQAATKIIDEAVSSGLLKKNTANRKKSHLAHVINTIA